MTTTETSTNEPIPSLTPDADASVAVLARSIGLKAVRAWVPDERKKRSQGAERVRRSREKARQSGVSQLSITLPTELHPILKTLAARTKAGESPSALLSELLPGLKLPAPMAVPAVLPVVAATPRKRLSAWRRWLVRWLLPADSRGWLN